MTVYARLSDLDSPEYQLSTDSQDVATAIDGLGERYLGGPPEDITGAVELIGEGEVLALYVTTSSRPWDLGAEYRKAF